MRKSVVHERRAEEMAKPNDAMLLCGDFACVSFFNGLRPLALPVRQSVRKIDNRSFAN
jgi:hypothetical protein